MQILVVGAGVVGLAVARAAAVAGHEVVVAEATSGIGNGVSSRNSEVIHAGLYYPTGSLRARHCTHGRRLLYAYCASHGVPHRKCGKLVVATNDSERERLASVHKQAQLNGVEGVEIIDAAAAKRLEPELACVAAMHSPETGIIDSHAFMLALRGDLEDRGGMVAFASPIERLKAARGDGWDAAVGGSEPQWLSFDAIVNCAGLGAQRLARATEGYPGERVPRLVLAKGNYFGFAGRPAFSRLIYPVPVPGGLGVHVTLDLAGRMRFGPDVQLLAATARRLARPGLRRRQAQAHRPRRGGGRFHDRGPGAARASPARAPVRNRVAGSHVCALARGRGRGRALALSRLTCDRERRWTRTRRLA
jgi:L-2-hydroxyglutarate oxidase LhgO